MRKFLLLGLLVAVLAVPMGAASQTKKKVIKYRSHTDLNFTEQMVQGKIRSPDVFYIFQRKRSDGPQIVQVPDRLNSLREQTRRVVEDHL